MKEERLMCLSEITKFKKADYGQFDPHHQTRSQDFQDAKTYIEKAFSRAWNADEAWQPIMLAAMSANKDSLINASSISAFDLYDKIILPFYASQGITPPPNSRRGNFTGHRLGNYFNNFGPFVYGGMSSTGKKLPQHIWTLKSIYRTNADLWKIIDHYWTERKAKGFQQSSRAKQAEIEAGEFLSNDATGFARTDSNLRAADAGVDAKAWFRGKIVPAQVKEFAVSKEVLSTYMMTEPMYKNGGALICTGIKPDAMEYIKTQASAFDMEVTHMTQDDLLSGKKTSKYIIKWVKK